MPFKFQPAALELPIPAARSDGVESSEAVRSEILVLFDSCAPGLRRYMWSFGLDAEAAEDVLQDAFLALFRHLCLGRPQTNLQGWLFRVAHNLALKHRHKVGRLRQSESEWDDARARRVVDPAADPEEQLTEVQRRHRLWSCLRALSDRDRQCFYLRAEGLAYRDIARTLGISLGSVAKSLTRVTTRLTLADTR